MGACVQNCDLRYGDGKHPRQRSAMPVRLPNKSGVAARLVTLQIGDMPSRANSEAHKDKRPGRLEHRWA